MRILNWNIRSGGGKKIDGILERISFHNPDIVVLTEYRTGNEQSITEGLKARGFRWVETSHPGDRENGILVASRLNLTCDLADVHEGDPQRWLSVSFPELGIKMIAVHVPGSPDHKFVDGVGISGPVRKERFWKKVIETAAWTPEPLILVGDFNTGLKKDAQGAPFTMSKYMLKLLDLGYVDAWRFTHQDTSEFTWFSQRKTGGETRDFNGFRLDYIFLPHLLSFRALAVFHSHEERLRGLSDHSLLICDVDVSGFLDEFQGHRDQDLAERQYKWSLDVLNNPNASDVEKARAEPIVEGQKRI